MNAKGLVVTIGGREFLVSGELSLGLGGSIKVVDVQTGGLTGTQYDSGQKYQEDSAQGSANTKQITASLWFKPDSSQANSVQRLWYNIAVLHAVSLPQASAYTAVYNANHHDLRDDETWPTDDAWHHLMFSVDVTDSSKYHLYLDGVDVVATHVFSAGDIRMDFALVFGAASGAGMNGGYSEWWWDDSYMDLSVEANRSKFRSVAGVPAYLGATGELPTGSTPKYYFPDGDASSNLGTFTGSWTLTNGPVSSIDGPGA